MGDFRCDKCGKNTIDELWELSSVEVRKNVYSFAICKKCVEDTSDINELVDIYSRNGEFDREYIFENMKNINIFAIKIRDQQLKKLLNEMNKDMNYVFDLISKASKESKSEHLMSEKALKLNEEVGELSAEVLKLSGYKPSDLTKEEIRERIISESVDSLLMIVDILTAVDTKQEEINQCVEKAVEKWRGHIKTKQEKLNK